MSRSGSIARALGLALFGLVVLGSVPARAEKPKAASAAQKKAPAKQAEPKSDPADEAKEAETSTPDEAKVKGADKAGQAKAVTTEDEKGVKTYEFGAIEVEGRLKSPQILYFLRRMRAEFEAGALGHRSFLRELADTRRDPAFR